MSDRNILWHYCSNTTFQLIVEKQELLLNEISHSNDSMEGKWLVEKVLRSALLKNKVSDRETNQFIEKIYSMKKRYNAFAFCLSDKSDVLSQWRGYADDGHGVAIGFNKLFLESLLGGNGPNLLVEVKYTTSDQLDLIGGNDEIFKIKDCIGRGALLHGDNGTLIGGPPSEEKKKERELAFQEMFRYVFFMALSSFQAKNPAFDEEKEWRLIQHNFINDQTGLGALGGESDYYDPNREDIVIRSSREKITPSIRCKIPIAESEMGRALSFPAILEVKLGPKNLSDINAVRYLVAKNMMGSPIVSRSNATYR